MYEIPKEIDAKIPNYFYPALAGELCGVFGVGIFRKNPVVDDNDVINWEDYYYDLQSGTSGWQSALKMACKKLDMMWLFEYYAQLEWYDSDEFDGIIENRIIEDFIKEDDYRTNGYYTYLHQSN